MTVTNTKKSKDIYAPTETRRTVTDFLNKEYRQYTFYVISERALPSMVDGFKNGARKIMHAAYAGTVKDGKEYKMQVLTGDTMKLSLYAHGDASLNSTIVTLAQTFRYNLPPLEVIGQSGSLRDPDAVGAPRYLYITMSKWSDLWKADQDILDWVHDEGERLEPKVYLPLLPAVLCQRAQGMAPGYRFYCNGYSPLDVCDACIEWLKSRKADCTPATVIRPYVEGLDNGKSWSFSEADGRWVSSGEFRTYPVKGIIEVTALPYDMTFEKFKALLDRKQEQGEIQSWKDMSRGNALHYVIQLPKGAFQKEYRKNEDRIWTQYKLRSKMPLDMLWVLDENDGVRHFQTPQDLLRHFMKYRLSRFDDRKVRTVKAMEDRIAQNDDLVKFIGLVCSGKLKIRNRPAADVKKDMAAYRLDYRLVQTTPLSRCTKEEQELLLKENKGLKEQLAYIRKTPTKKMYLTELEALRKRLAEAF